MLILFEDVPQTELSPAGLVCLERRRAGWVRRQRLCRARRQMTPREQMEARAQAAQALLQSECRQLVLREDRGEYPLSVISHEWFFLYAMQLGGWIAQQIFESVTPADFSQTVHRHVFEAAAKIHARGAVVSIAGVRAQLKRDGVILGDLACYELGSCPLPRLVAGDVENHVRQLKCA